MELLVILSYTKATPTGAVHGSIQRTATVGERTTRADVFEWAVQQLPPEMRDATCTFFYAEPNPIGGER